MNLRFRTVLGLLGGILAYLAGCTAVSAQDSLPSSPGETVRSIQSMQPGTWLDLGSPAPDPKWGKARGRAWTSKMAFSAAMGGAFLFGEGVHGWVNPASGRYMDGLWFYDANGHRWVNLYPGTDTRNPPSLVVTKDGFEGVARDRPVPIATMVHGYEMTAWDPATQLFFAMPNHHPYFARHLPGVQDFRRRNATHLNRRNASPWMFDPWNRRWHRLKTQTSSPPSKPGHVIQYIPSLRKIFHYAPRQVHFYDPSRNTWSRPAVSGPQPPFGIDPVTCHDSIRDRIYIGGGKYPPAPGNNALWIYDVSEYRWINPEPKGGTGHKTYGTNAAIMGCEAEKNRVTLFIYRGRNPGVYVYDAAENAWSKQQTTLPEYWRKNRTANGFYHPDLKVHFFHAAHDSRDDGRIFVYRPAE